MLALFCLVVPGTPSAAGIFVVTTTQDLVPGSLRAAITSAEAPPSAADTIVFAIPGPGPHVIMPLMALPTLTDRAGLLIDGLTQPGSAPGASPPSTATLLIVLDGSAAGASHGIWIMSPHNTIRGLVIRGFQRDGIRIQATPQGTFNNRIYCNFIGTTVNGAAAAGNGTNQLSPWAGVNVLADPMTLGFATANTILANLISGNYSEGVSISSCPPADVAFTAVDSNYIGTDITGMIDLGNRVNGVYIGEAAHDNQIMHNLIAGNDTDGVCIVGYADQSVQWYTPQNLVTANVIGLAVDRTTPLPNGRDGVMIGIYGAAWKLGFAPRNHVWRNLIAHNGRNGVSVWEHPLNAFNADNNRISQNAIRNNGALGIDLRIDGVTPNDPGDPDTDANQLLNVPLLSRATVTAGVDTVSGSIAIDTDPTKATVEVFIAQPCAAGSGQGRTFVGSSTPDPAGNWTLSGTGLLAGIDTVTATVTDSAGNTSEFSVVLPVNPPRIAASPSLDFGSVPVAGSATRRLTVYNTGASPLAVATASIPPGVFAVDSGAAPYTIAAGDSAVMRLRFTPAAAGPAAASLTIASNAFNAPSLVVSLTGTGLGQAPVIVLGATALDFGTLLPGTASTRTLRVSNTGTDTLIISGTAITGADAPSYTVIRTCGNRIPPGASDSLDLRFAPGATGVKTAAVQISSNDPNLPVAAAALTGTCVSSMPVISLSAAALDFGTVLPGGTRTRTMRVTNTGTDTLIISGTAITGADAPSYTVIRTCGNRIPPAASDSLDLRFAPGATGVKTAAVQISSNDPNLPVTAAALTGTCVSSMPVASLSAMALDFGTLLPGGARTRTLRVTNTGTDTLIISGTAIAGADAPSYTILRTCGNRIPPGASDSLDLRFAPGATGVKTASLQITSNDPNLPVAAAALTGKCMSSMPVASLSAMALDFGTLLPGGARTRTLRVTNTGTDTLIISGTAIAGADAPSYTILRTCGNRIPPGASDSLDLRFAPGATGVKTASLQITSNDPNLPVAAAALTGTCVSSMPVVSLSAAALDFGTLLPGGARTRTLRVTNTGTDTLIISGTAIAGSDAPSYTILRTCGNRIPPGASDSLDLRFAPGATGVKTAALQIASNDPNLPTARVGLTGVCSTAAPVISLSTTALNFGTVTVGSSRTRFLTIRNNGSVTLAVSRSAISGPDSLMFAIVQPCGAGIAPGGADSVGIRFMPTAARAMSAQLALTSNDPVTPLATVQLTGLGATGVPQLVTSDSALDFGVTMQGSPVARTLVVSNTGTGALNVSGCVLVGPDRAQYLFTRASALRIEAGARDTVRLLFDPTTLGIKRASMSLTSDDPVRPSLQIPLSGICATTTGPRLVLGRTMLDFGSVPVQGTKDEDLTLQNTGSADLRITQQSIGGANGSEFSIAQRADSVLIPGAGTMLRVRHAPVTTGSKTAVLRLQTNDAAMPTADIALIAIVVAVDAPEAAPRGVALHANYPNPFDPVTTMTYELAGESAVDLALYSAIGTRVLTVDRGLRGAGVHVVACDAGTLPAGAYTALLVATDARGHRSTARIGLLRVR